MQAKHPASLCQKLRVTDRQCGQTKLPFRSVAAIQEWKILKFALIALGLLGVAALVIGAMNFIAGPHWTAGVVSGQLSTHIAAKPYSGGLDSANADSEMRFYAVFWIAYRALLLWAFSRESLDRRIVYAALALFFMGGAGQALSDLLFGWPDPLFQVRMWIELSAPVVVGIEVGLPTRHRA